MLIIRIIIIILLSLIASINLKGQDTIINCDGDSLFVSYYDDYNYVTNEVMDEFITYHDCDYEYFVDENQAPIQLLCEGGVCHYIFYGTVDPVLMEAFDGTNAVLSYVMLRLEDCKEISLSWDAMKRKGYISIQHYDNTFEHSENYEGWNGLKHLLFRWEHLTKDY